LQVKTYNPRDHGLRDLYVSFQYAYSLLKKRAQPKHTSLRNALKKKCVCHIGFTPSQGNSGHELNHGVEPRLEGL